MANLASFVGSEPDSSEDADVDSCCCPPASTADRYFSACNGIPLAAALAPEAGCSNSTELSPLTPSRSATQLLPSSVRKFDLGDLPPGSAPMISYISKSLFDAEPGSLLIHVNARDALQASC